MRRTFRDAWSAAQPVFSFEFFPPKDDQQAAQLDETIVRLAPFRPAGVSVTYGAGGSSQQRSFGMVRALTDRGLAVAAHLTCAGASCAEVEAAIDAFRAAGVQRFVALRGDNPGGLGLPYQAHPAGYSDTAELVRTLKRAGAADVAVSAYPEKHPDSPDWDSELDTLKRKVDAGADRAITQFFFDNDVFESYLERVRRAGIAIPIIPGIMPVHRFASVRSFAERCGASIPEQLARRFEDLPHEGATHGLVAAAIAVEQIADLAERGVRAFHLYTLNRAELTEAICRFFGAQLDESRAAAAA